MEGSALFRFNARSGIGVRQWQEDAVSGADSWKQYGPAAPACGGLFSLVYVSPCTPAAAAAVT